MPPRCEQRGSSGSSRRTVSRETGPLASTTGNQDDAELINLAAERTRCDVFCRRKVGEGRVAKVGEGWVAGRGQTHLDGMTVPGEGPPTELDSHK